jgi:hypothetical protein
MSCIDHAPVLGASRVTLVGDARASPKAEVAAIWE